jgi:formylmethanofuran dehydrogenase subunit E
VLGARIGFHGAALLDIPLPLREKELLVIAETDGCFLDGLIAATGAAPGRRTLRIEDHGKVAATLVATATNRAVRLVPARDSRQRALAYAPDAPSRRAAQILAYQIMPAAELLTWREVRLSPPLEVLLGVHRARVHCAGCGEEVINGRERIAAGRRLCRACAGDSYYVSS